MLTNNIYKFFYKVLLNLKIKALTKLNVSRQRFIGLLFLSGLLNEFATYPSSNIMYIHSFIYNISNFFFLDWSFCDAAVPWQLGFQDPATPQMEGIIEFHNSLMFFLVLIAIFVIWIMARCFYFYNEEVQVKSEMFTHSTPLEIIWTILPALILLIIAIPSFALLYSVDEGMDSTTGIKIIGHQWYWSYEFSDHPLLENNHAWMLKFDSYMLQMEDLNIGHLRLLEVDNRIVLPAGSYLRVYVTAVDVLHSWAIPSFGVKVDACPGRLNKFNMLIKRTGTFYGQCSEICGVNHGFMPIVVKAVPFDKYCAWWNRDAVQDIGVNGSDSTSQTSPLGGVEYSTKKKDNAPDVVKYKEPEYSESCWPDCKKPFRENPNKVDMSARPEKEKWFRVLSACAVVYGICWLAGVGTAVATGKPIPLLPLPWTPHLEILYSGPAPLAIEMTHINGTTLQYIQHCNPVTP